MLRPTPTKLELTTRDLGWHIDRHHRRKTQYDGDICALPRSRKLMVDEPSVSRLPRVPHPATSRLAGANHAANDDLVSNDPVPANSRAFWDSIMAMAGTSSTNQEPFLHERHVEEQEQDVSFESSASYNSPSFMESSDGVRQSSGDREGDESVDINNAFEDPRKASYRSVRLQSQISWPSVSAVGNETGEAVDLHSNRVVECVDSKKSERRNNGFLGYYRTGYDGRVDEQDISEIANSFSGQLDLDGSVEIRMECEALRPVHSPAASDRSQPMLRYTPHTFEQYSEDEIGAGDEATKLDMAADYHWPSEQIESPFLPLLKPVDRLRSRSSVLPRSPLYMSQAAASSSPEKALETSCCLIGTDNLHKINPVFLHSRHTKWCKLRNKAHHYGDSNLSLHSERANEVDDSAPLNDGLLEALQLFIDGSSTMGNEPDEAPQSTNLTNPQNQAQGYPNREAVSTLFLSSSVNSDVCLPQQTQSSSSQPVSHRNVSTLTTSLEHTHNPPEPAEIDPFDHSPTVITSSPTLPPPFSTTRRSVSFNLVLPTSSSANPFTSPVRALSPLTSETASSPDPSLSQPQNSFHTPLYYSSRPRKEETEPMPSNLSTRPLPLARHSPYSSPTLPMTPHGIMRVYNDALPTAFQPQTHVGLPRHGVLDPTYSGLSALTAPTGVRAGVDRRAWESPTRFAQRSSNRRRDNGRIGSLEEQENASVFEEAHRRMRHREQAVHRRVMVDREEDGEARGDLVRTPEREEG
ncbi:hypothetical protein MMC19_006349 [Ptychographa xylographoides]|nr:hypothetical protein [Ptychographa xylographoides]